MGMYHYVRSHKAPINMSELTDDKINEEINK